MSHPGNVAYHGKQLVWSLAVTERMRDFHLSQMRAKFFPQSALGLCGVASLRSLLASQFHLEKNEEEILQKIYFFYRQHYQTNPQKYFRKNGSSPSALAFCLRQFVPGLKIFCSKKGSLFILNHLLARNLLPVIHYLVSYPRESILREGHYSLFLGLQNHKVLLFDPHPGQGIKKLSPTAFNRLWQNKDEKWFLVALPPKIKLSKKKFSGKYL